jgi:DNA-binding MarR family transcriptional regulator
MNLTIPQMKCLFYISRHGRINLSGLAAGIHVTRQMLPE